MTETQKTSGTRKAGTVHKEKVPAASAEFCRILARDEFMDNDTRKTGLNNNDLIIGPSGAGKTRGYVIPNILQCNGSMIITDTKGSIRDQVEGILKKKGYRVLSIDFTDCGEGCGYNPLDFIRYDEKTGRYKEQDILTVAACLIPLTDMKEPVWELSARMYVESMIGYVLECLPREEHNLISVMKLFQEMPTGRYDRLFRELSELNPESFAAIRYNLYKTAKHAERMYESIRAYISMRLSALSFEAVKRMLTAAERISFADLGREKTAVFVCISDTDRSMDYLAGLFYTQALQVLCASADKESVDCRLKVPVRIILDDFAANMVIPDFDKITSVIRSREIHVSIILQSISQLESLYGHARAMTIINNCDNLLYLGGQDVETARYMSGKANRTLDSVLNMPLEQAWLFTRGRQPKPVQKYDIRCHRHYRNLPEYRRKNQNQEKKEVPHEGTTEYKGLCQNPGGPSEGEASGLPDRGTRGDEK